MKIRKMSVFIETLFDLYKIIKLYNVNIIFKIL